LRQTKLIVLKGTHNSWEKKKGDETAHGEKSISIGCWGKPFIQATEKNTTLYRNPDEKT